MNTPEFHQENPCAYVIIIMITKISPMIKNHEKITKLDFVIKFMNIS